ncbi:uncharacterized protein LOC143300165 isoform X1 [Babylonia areolata]|uniref:uncharacterized protein LOC143300165 isoform X1 n=1 Tax=Babylonia areolata TaxID=304850 RepID=UPI003FD36140
MDPFQQGNQRERQRILDALKGYPCSFQMKDVQLVTNKAAEGLRNHLEAGLKAGYKTSLQTAASRNLLAFVLFKLGEHKAALEETEEVLKMDDQRNNIVSLANKSHMLSYMNCFDEAEEVLDELKELVKTEENGYLLVKAEAELAASYMRFGPRFNMHAADAFNKVLPRAREPEVWCWKFGLAVTYRHSLDLQHAPYVSHGQSAITHNHVLGLLKDVINSKPAAADEAAVTNLKANAYAEMALLFHLAWDKTKKYQLCSQVETGPLPCCKKAQELDDNDASVLWKLGKLYRNYRDLFRSKKLLEKAVSLQPSSAAFHHLGLTYKAMATNQQYGKLKTRRAGKRQKQRKEAREEKMKRQEAESGDVVQRAVSQGLAVSGKKISECEKVERIKKAVKSPDDATQFDPDESLPQKAIENLKKAIEFSAGENSRAAYDLALLYKSMKEFKPALDLLNSIARRQNSEIATPSGMLEQVTAQEQMALIYKEMAEEEEGEGEREKLLKKSKSMLDRSLLLADQRYSNVADVKDNFAEIFHSPKLLLEAADASDQTDEDKRKTKIKIHSLSNNPRQSQKLLAEVPEDKRDAELKKLEIDVCSKRGDHKKAADVMLDLKEQKTEVIDLFKRQRQEHVIFDIYFNAGRESLFLDPSVAGKYFAEAFRHEVKPPVLQASSNDSTNLLEATAMDRASVDRGSKALWDVMLLHDEEDDDIELEADRLRHLLKTACGLRVVKRIENHPLGSKVTAAFVENTENSRIVVVLPGKKDSLPEFEEHVSLAAQNNCVVLLTEGTGPEAIPQELTKRHVRSMPCPAELTAPDNVAADGGYKPESVHAICRLLKFLVNRD